MVKLKIKQDLEVLDLLRNKCIEVDANLKVSVNRDYSGAETYWKPSFEIRQKKQMKTLGIFDRYDLIMTINDAQNRVSFDYSTKILSKIDNETEPIMNAISLLERKSDASIFIWDRKNRQKWKIFAESVGKDLANLIRKNVVVEPYNEKMLIAPQ